MFTGSLDLREKLACSMANLAHGAATWVRGTGERLAAWGRRAGDGLIGRLPAPAQERVRRTTRVALAVRAKAAGDDLGTQAAAMTFTAFLALLPLVLLALSVAGYAVSQTQGLAWIRQAERQIPGLDGFVNGQLDTLQAARLRLGLIGLAGVTWSASALSVRATRALGVVFGLHPSALAGRLRAIGAMALLGVLFVLTLGANGLVASVRIGGPLSGLTWVVTFALLAIVSFVFFLAGYEVLTPGGPMGLRDHVPGAVLMALGWQLLVTFGTLLIARSIARSTALYGAIASLFGMLAFLRMAMSLWLYGAELSAVRFGERHPASSGAPEADPALD
jgi:YihY family inner membrane protein